MKRAASDESRQSGPDAAESTFLVNYEKTFDWFDFLQGRIRYEGRARGRDEPPIEVFAIEAFGSTYYGEIRRDFLPDAKTYFVRVVSFGWLEKNWYGSEPDPRFCASFLPSQLEDAQILICQGITAWNELEDKPSFLFSTRSRFTGDVVFQVGWALLKGDKDS